MIPPSEQLNEPPSPSLNASSASPGPASTAPIEAGPDSQSDHQLNLSLTEFLDLTTLQEIQDSFTTVTRWVVSIRDAQGRPLTRPTNTRQRDESDQLLDWLMSGDEEVQQHGGVDQESLVAPIVVEGKQLGSITIANRAPVDFAHGHDRLRKVAVALNLRKDQLDTLVQTADDCCGPNKAASVQLLYLLANSIARLCYQEYQLRQRVDELSILYRLSTDLSRHRDLPGVLDSAARSAAAMTGASAVCIRMVDESQRELMTAAGFNLEILNQQVTHIDDVPLFQEVLQGNIIYVEDVKADPRVVGHEQELQNGLVSTLCAPMILQNKPIGLIQLFTETRHRLSQAQIKLMRAIAQLLATAINDARLDAELRENRQVQRQLKLAADVQKRMLPASPPHCPPFDIAAKYVPSLDLGGDFYDFIDLDGNLGIAVGDVVGKGVAASLLMASVRSALRAFAQDVYDIDEIMSRVNVQLTGDVLDKEFATLFYGVLDIQTRRLTYCNAGHEPPLLLRDNQIIRLETGGMIVGIDASQHYEKGLIDLRPGDLLLLYTDGLADAMDFNDQRYGRERVIRSMYEVPSSSATGDLNHILWSMRRFAGLNRRTDDTTLVVIRVEH